WFRSGRHAGNSRGRGVSRWPSSSRAPGPPRRWWILTTCFSTSTPRTIGGRCDAEPAPAQPRPGAGRMRMLMILVAIGGAAGAVARYQLSAWMQTWAGIAFPWGTLTVNLVGCVALGGAMRVLHA